MRSTGAERTGQETLWAVVSLTVVTSIVLHGISGTPLTRAMARLPQRRRREEGGERARNTSRPHSLSAPLRERGAGRVPDRDPQG